MDTKSIHAPMFTINILFSLFCRGIGTGSTKLIAKCREHLYCHPEVAVELSREASSFLKPVVLRLQLFLHAVHFQTELSNHQVEGRVALVVLPRASYSTQRKALEMSI